MFLGSYHNRGTSSSGWKQCCGKEEVKIPLLDGSIYGSKSLVSFKSSRTDTVRIGIQSSKKKMALTFPKRMGDIILFLSSSIKVKNWKKVAKSRDGWKRLLEKARAHPGCRAIEEEV
ncbi:hypothetical protein TNCV_3541841 [Trichonephila clavipes]|nr:hypothetical protein TNCV_3541841 [Trichonephila clavipes]